MLIIISILVVFPWLLMELRFKFTLIFLTIKIWTNVYGHYLNDTQFLTFIMIVVIMLRFYSNLIVVSNNSEFFSLILVSNFKMRTIYLRICLYARILIFILRWVSYILTRSRARYNITFLHIFVFNLLFDYYSLLIVFSKELCLLSLINRLIDLSFFVHF
jgi:hypothetical protein